MTFYLKHRPQSLKDLDQENVRLALEKIVKSKNIPHAFLFSGPKGTGKTSSARILAKLINCEKQGNEPCNECEQCISISKGQNIDVIELDAASHRGIEDIRMIRDAVKLSPAKARKKVYIIDEAHMLTTEASNALLKTLEEPPDHVVFILATTNPEKLIDTVRSRVTNIQFKKATADEIIISLKKLAMKEEIKISGEFLNEIARKADGSFRDAHKILEQLALEGVDFEKGIGDFLKTQQSFNTDNFISLIAKKDAKSALTLIEEAIISGQGTKEIAESVLTKLRNLLFSYFDLSQEANENKFTKDELVNLIKLFSDASAKINNSLIEQIPIEIAIIEWCEDVGGVNGIKSTKGTKEENGVKNKAEETKTQMKSKVDVKKKTSESTENKIENKVSDIPENHVNTDNVQSSVSIDDKVWREILTKVKPGHTSTEALLRAAKPLEFNGSILKLGVYYKFHKERLEEKQHRDILEEALEIYLGFPVKVICTLTAPPMVNNDFAQEPEVVLEEPQAKLPPTSTVLTGDGNQDIISLAEKIFSN